MNEGIRTIYQVNNVYLKLFLINKFYELLALQKENDMTLQLRKVLKSVSSKNQSLQDILRSSKEAQSVLSITKQLHGVHNTQIVLQMNNGESRVQYYNRINLASILETGLDLPKNDLPLLVKTLNTLYGCDFTEDDLIVVEGWLEAKPESIGYIGKVQLKANTIPTEVTYYTNLV